MSLAPDRWHAFARAAVRAKFPDSWRTDELVAAAVERYAELHARQALPDIPSELAVIARNAAIDELRRLEGRGGADRWALSLDAMRTPQGDPIDQVDPAAGEFPDRIADELLAEYRAGRLWGSRLTPRERRVVMALARTGTQAQAAALLQTTASDVSQCVNQIARRLERLTT